MITAETAEAGSTVEVTEETVAVGEEATDHAPSTVPASWGDFEA
jgi:hypothetical protein